MKSELSAVDRESLKEARLALVAVRDGFNPRIELHARIDDVVAEIEGMLGY